MPENWVSLLFKFFKFGCTGLIGMIWDFGTTYFLKEHLKVQKYMASTVGLFVGATSNYIINSLWTFNHKSALSLPQYLNFLLISLLGFALNLSLIYFLHQKKNVNFYFAKFIAIVLVFLWNFMMNYFFTFKK